VEGTYPTYLEALHSGLQDVRWDTYGSCRAGPLVCFSTPAKGGKWLYVTAGCHGEEPYGPLTFVRHGQVLIDMAKASGVGLRVYPCINPSDWSYDARRLTPTSFFEYEVGDGAWARALKPDMELRDMRIKTDLPPESRALVADLALKPVPKAVLEIHQDHDLHDSPATYAFVSGDQTPYRSLARAASRFTKLAANMEVSGEYAKQKTDRFGLTPGLPDGTVQDYFDRLGTKYSATLETSTSLPLKSVMGVNLVWVMGFIELASR
jgi:hypothetical protein